MLGLGVLAVESACATLSRMLSAAALSRTMSLGSTCWMTSEKGIFLGATAKLRPTDSTLSSTVLSSCLLRLITVFLVGGTGA